MIVSVFGSSKGVPGMLNYEQAYRLGQGLAKSGFSVMTGAYCGTMEAVSKGAAELGVETYGVTCEDIEKWRPDGPNPWVKTIIATSNLNRRLEVLSRQPDAMIALPGGIGTLLEAALCWNLIVVESIAAKPLILIGEGWKKSFDALFEAQSEFIKEKDRLIPHFVSDEDEAVRLVRKLLV